MKALIVDDEPSVRLLLSRVLRREVECTVSEATNGIEALDLLGRESFDFVVIDVMMPMMDGLETLEAIRSTPSLRHLPVMVLSAVRDEARVRQLVALGISAYLTKPLRPLEAAARVQQFVASVWSSSHAAAARARLAFADQSRILVVDGNPDYRSVVRVALSARFQLVEAEGGAQGLRACLETRPAAVLLGQELGAVPSGMFLRKLRSLQGLSTVPVVFANDSGQPEPGIEADAFIERTFAPERVQQQFDRLVSGVLAPPPDLLKDRHELRGQMVLATQQVFGMMLGVEVVASGDDADEPGEGADLVRVQFAVAQWDAGIEFGITMSRDMSERMTAILKDRADLVTEEDVTATLSQVAAIVAARIQNALRGRGDEVVTSAPDVSVIAAAEELAADWVPVDFHDAARDVRFTTYLRPVRRDEDVMATRDARAS